MRKSHKAFLIFLLFAGSMFAQIEISNTVTFNADMSDMIAAGFNPQTDSIRIQGLVWESTGTTTYTGNPILLADPAQPTTFKTTLTITSTLNVGDSLRWKFFVWPADKFVGGSWEGFPSGEYDGRPYILQANNAIINLEPIKPRYTAIITGLGPQNTWHFMVDLTDIIGTGSGYFDPTQDNIIVEGLVWADTTKGIGVVAIVSGSRIMQQNPLLPGVIYETTLVVELDPANVVGDSIRWKFNATPSGRWSNNGWENGVGRFTVFQPNGSTVDLGPYKPDLIPNFTLKNDSKILFQVDMNHHATNRYDNSLIPLDQIQFVSLRGSHVLLGSWSGVWEPIDTINPGVPALYDGGILGDKVKGDNIYSRLVTFPKDSLGGQISYKYGVYYPGCELISATYYMDGFGGTGQDLTVSILERSEVFEVLDIWPNNGGAVSVRQLDDQMPDKFDMEQNYPNPFNPSTTIKYTLDNLANVNLSIYNVLGQKVMDLVNSLQNAGTYEVKFDGASLSSGLYFYSLSNGANTITKKMMLLK